MWLIVTFKSFVYQRTGRGRLSETKETETQVPKGTFRKEIRLGVW